MDKRVHLPVAAGEGALRPDGRRAWIIPADVRGRFTRARRLVYVLLVAIWIALPLVRIGGGPAVFLDVDHRRFHLFGLTFDSQDTWLLFFLVTGVMFALVFLTTLLGRVFCGWACPMTVFMETLYRPIERLVGGSREQRIRDRKTPWAAGSVARKVGEHALFVLASAFVAHVFLAYFVSVPGLFGMIGGRPSAHPEAFVWVVSMTIVFWVAFGFFREQFCVVVCPYGRLQSVLQDDHSLVVGYDAKRGEPRGKATDPNAGACVDCKRCVVVCPTGIDIRNGLQMDCVACTACIDACDEIMDKLGRPRGLVRYDSLRGLAGEPTRWLRPRVALYGLLLVAGMAVFGVALTGRHGFEANLVRQSGAPFVIEGDVVRNSFEVHVVNKRPERRTFRIAASTDARGADVLVAQPEIALEPLEHRRVPIVTTLPKGERGTLVVHVTADGAEAEILREAKLLGPVR